MNKTCGIFVAKLWHCGICGRDATKMPQKYKINYLIIIKLNQLWHIFVLWHDTRL